VAAYHHATVEVAVHGTAVSLDRLGRLQHELEEQDGWRRMGREIGCKPLFTRHRRTSAVSGERSGGEFESPLFAQREAIQHSDFLRPVTHENVGAIRSQAPALSSEGKLSQQPEITIDSKESDF
jgi:hypothetical protein